MRQITVVLAATCAICALATIVHAGSVSKCTASKIKAVGKNTACLLALEAKEAKIGQAKDADKSAACGQKMTHAFVNADLKGPDCLTDDDDEAVEGDVEAFVDGLDGNLAGTPNDPPPSTSRCTGVKLKAAGKNVKCRLGLVAKQFASSTPLDPTKDGACREKMTDTFRKAEALADCLQPEGDAGVIDETIDHFIEGLIELFNGTLPTAIKFTTTAATSSCGSAGLTTPPSAPSSGAIDSDTTGTVTISNLGRGCLYFGGGNATVIAGARIPDGARALIAVRPGRLAGSDTGDPETCTVKAGPGRHCVNNNSSPACTDDGGCGGAAGACALDANCFFGPPLPIFSPPPFGSVSACVMNLVQGDVSGTFDEGSGSASVTLPLAARLYLTGNTASPCPKCLAGVCDPTWKTNANTTSPDSGAACTAVGSLATSSQCRPSLPGFQAPLTITLSPLTTGTVSKTAADGSFCAGQATPGAFGQAAAQSIAENGTAVGDVSDGLPHPAQLGSVFCVPSSGNSAVDGVGDLPGPGAVGLTGMIQVIF